MKEFKVDFSDIYSYVIYFATTSFYGDNIFIVSENFVSEKRLAFSTQRQYFNLNHMLNLKQFKIEVFK